jgi:hypothetical protein
LKREPLRYSVRTLQILQPAAYIDDDDDDYDDDDKIIIIKFVHVCITQYAKP